VLINNHTAVWGSYWRDGAWGYACCHQFVKNSYCIGDAGSKAADEQTAQVNGIVVLTHLLADFVHWSSDRVWPEGSKVPRAACQ
jgi:hypothetical protein